MILIKSFRIKRGVPVISAAFLCILLGALVFYLCNGDFVSAAARRGGLEKKAGINANAMAVFLASEKENSFLEIFDVKSEKVVKKLSMDAAYKTAARNFLGSINGVYVKVNAFPQTGFIVRVPFSPAISLHNDWYNGVVDQVFVLFPTNESPYLLVLDDKSHPMFYNFASDTGDFLKSLDYEPADNITPRPSVSPAGDCSSHNL